LISGRGACLGQDRFPDHFDCREMGAQQIEIRHAEHLQQLVGRVAARGHAGQSGAFDGTIGRRALCVIQLHGDQNIL